MASPALTNISSVSASSDQDYVKVPKSEFAAMMTMFQEFMETRKEEEQQQQQQQQQTLEIAKKTSTAPATVLKG